MGSAFGPHTGGQFPVWQNDPRPKMDNLRSNDAVVCNVKAESVAFNGRRARIEAGERALNQGGAN